MRNFVGIGLALCLSAAQAQNLVQNPRFDDDAAGWNLSTHATWSNRIDYDGSATSGALQISTGSDDDGAQCIDLRGATRYVISVWAEQDPQDSIAPCASPEHHVTFSMFGSAHCAGSDEGTFATAERRPEFDGWQQAQLSFTTPATARSGLLSLVGSCNSGSGISIYYYDDVFIGLDEIFTTDFEQHAPEGGPGQPPGG